MSTNQYENEHVNFDVHSICEGHHHVTYRGVKAIRCPFDFVLYQMIISELQPDLIIEIGTNAGGGALYLADILNNIGHGVVHTIDIVSQSSPLVAAHPRIKLFTNGWQNYDLEEARKFSKVLVIEDASHTYEDTLAALRKFAPIISPCSYLIVEDGIINNLGMEAEYHGGPLRAIREFLESNKNFSVDRKWCDFFGKNATFSVNGYLRRKEVVSPKVSLCIPAYNQTNYLRKTLDSIVDQTYQDFEIIVTDDSSDDSVERLLNQYNFGPKLKYFRNSVRKGSPENWNEAVRRASGEYIKLIHHDDWFTDRESLSQYVSLLDSNPSVDFAFSSTIVQSAANGRQRIHKALPEYLNLLKQEPTCLFFGNLIGAPSATIYRNRPGLLYDGKMKWLVDLDFYIRLLLHNCSFAHSDAPLITTITAAAHTVTNECENNKQIELFEYFHLFRKIDDNIPLQRRESYIEVLRNLLSKYNVSSLDELKDCDNTTRGLVLQFMQNTLKEHPVSPAPVDGRQQCTTGIIFSKDRAMQLDATLRSFFLHCTDPDQIVLKVLYTTSGPLHEAQYRKLKQEYPSVEFIKEVSFKSDLLFATSRYEYVLFLVDDNIFIRDFSLADAIGSLAKNQDALGFSLRLGENTTYCYMLDKQQALPEFSSLGHGILKYAWTTAEYDFGYPLELSSSLYRTADILSLLQQLDFSNPNTLEAQMDANKTVFTAKRSSLLSYESSVTFCNPINKVQTVFNNKAGIYNTYSPDNLAEQFTLGFQIDIAPFESFTPNSCHQEVELRFVSKSGETQEYATIDRSGQTLVSIVILNYNGMEHIRPCLESIRRNTLENHEIIIVDNASTDGSREYLRSCSGIILVENQTNIGCPPARAQAMSLAKGDYLIFLDNDTIVTRNWVKRFIDHAKANPQIGMIGPRSNYVSGAQLVPDALYKDVSKLEAFADNFSRQHNGQLTKTFRLVGFCMFIRREVIDKIGSIDASFGKFGFEDDDYTWRANIAGFTAAIANDVFIHHTGGPQGSGNQEYNKLMLDAWEMFKKKWGLQPDLPYGSNYDIVKLLQQSFDPQKHYCPLLDRSSVEKLIYIDPLANKVTEAFAAANHAASEGKWDDAHAIITNLLKDSPDLGVGYAGLGSILIGKGDYQGAIKSLEKAVTLLPEESSIRVQLAQTYRTEGAYEKAIEHILKAVELAPLNPEVLFMFGALGADIGNVDAAQNAFSKLKEVAPNHAGIKELQILLDQVVDKAGLQVPQEDSLHELSDVNTPTGEKTLMMKTIEKAWEQYHKDEIEAAIFTLLEAIGYAPNEKKSYHCIAEILIARKHFKAAEDTINSMPEDIRKDVRSLELAGYCKEGMGLYKEADELANRVLSINPNSASALNLKGRLALKKDDRNTAENLFNKAMESDPGLWEPYFSLGELKLAEGQKDEALSFIEKGFILSPIMPDMAALYYSSAIETGNIERAEQLFRDAKALYPLNKKIAFLLIDLLIRQGKNDAAMTEIEDALITFGIDDGMLQAALEVRDKVGAKKIEGTSKNRATISLCMIVKNEEKYLPKCLMSVKPVVDQMVVVDTGSSDRTKDIARAFGAEVYDFEWKDNFADARNMSLSKAKGDWVFILDADEAISALDYRLFSETVNKRSSTPSAYLINTRNYIHSPNIDGWIANDGKYSSEEAGTGWNPTNKVRLFPNDGRIRFENPVHELVEPSLRRVGIEIIKSDIQVHHYGKLDIEKVESKGKKYFALGEKKLENNESDPKSLFELAVQAGEIKEFQKAIELWQKLLNLNTPAAKGFHLIAYINMGNAYIGLGKLENAFEASKKAIKLNPNSESAVINYGLSALWLGEAGKAIPVLENLMLTRSDYPPAIGLLSVAYIMEGKMQTGVEYLDKIKRMGYDGAAYLLDHANKLISAGRVDSATSLLEAAIKSKNVNNEILSLLSECRKS